jgi:hypothetical protein
MTRAYEEIIEFIAAGTTPQSLINFQPSEVAKDRVADLIFREKTAALRVPQLLALFMTISQSYQSVHIEDTLPIAFTLSDTHQERATVNGIFEQGTKQGTTTKIWLLC